MYTRAQVRRDLTVFHTELQQSGVQCHTLLQPSALRVLADVAFDVAAIALVTAACLAFGFWLVPLAVLLIGNRQRSLGNILHDGSHGALHRCRAVNDAMLRLLLAPGLFVCATRYRAEHFRHHAQLGDPVGDPDYIAPLEEASTWSTRLARLAFDARTWWGSLAGDLGRRDVAATAKVAIAAWWAALASGVACLAGIEATLAFVTLWLLARASAFHLITCYREICDHHGLVPGGICSYTRDIVANGPRTWLVHPRNNGLHLTHHLLPAVPYHRLRAAQELFCTLKHYRTHALVHTDYRFACSAPGGASTLAGAN
jgi:fatty acid desaturase